MISSQDMDDVKPQETPSAQCTLTIRTSPHFWKRFTGYVQQQTLKIE